MNLEDVLREISGRGRAEAPAEDRAYRTTDGYSLTKAQVQKAQRAAERTGIVGVFAEKLLLEMIANPNVSPLLLDGPAMGMMVNKAVMMADQFVGNIESKAKVVNNALCNEFGIPCEPIR